ncbi:MAG: hypothetical protein V4696_01625 [Pseudomonadota bacterium]
MSDMGDFYHALRDHRRSVRQQLGRECPECGVARSLANASILMPGQRCRVDGYVDPRAKKGEVR